MTCIAGVVRDGRVWIGGDSAGISGWSLTLRADEKVFRNGAFAFGFTSSFRMGQLLRYAFTPPDHDPRVDPDKFMVTTFIDAVRSCLKAGGFAKKENETEHGGTFLVGYRGGLYEVDEDYQVGKPIDAIAAVGCGAELALGAMFATPQLEPEERVRTALTAAERMNAGVRSPFHVVSTDAS